MNMPRCCKLRHSTECKGLEIVVTGLYVGQSQYIIRSFFFRHDDGWTYDRDTYLIRACDDFETKWRVYLEDLFRHGWKIIDEKEKGGEECHD